jgi:DNA polymerase-3 subunit alpha
MKLEGLTRHASTHAAGVVIGDRPLDELLPMMVDKDGNDVTQYSMTYVEKVGLVKFDFLGLKTLTVLHTACAIIKESRGVEIDLNTLPLNDAKTYTLLCGGNTTGVFQLESSGITEMVVRLKPSGFDDIVAMLALYRPGPLDAGMVDHYIERKHGREPISYLHPLMKDILMDTYGVILYQEQIMQLARALSGYSLGEADLKAALPIANGLADEIIKQEVFIPCFHLQPLQPLARLGLHDAAQDAITTLAHAVTPLRKRGGFGMWSPLGLLSIGHA